MYGPLVTYSKKVFIPLTKLCRDSCGYCTFAHPPVSGERAYLTPEEVRLIARAGASAGCGEALFTLGDKPERKWRGARDELDELGFETTIDYLAAACRVALEEGLLPHTNPGAIGYDDALALRAVSVSQGMMLETLSDRLLRRGAPHFGAPDKRPDVRLASLDAAGRARVPFTTGVLVGIGETWHERVEALLAIRRSHEQHGHVQEVIVQNFRSKTGTRMWRHPEPDAREMKAAIALARLILPLDVAVQAPPNLALGAYGEYLECGINDWGGISPVTPDHVNPERPWPHLDELAGATERAGFVLKERLAVYPRYCSTPAARAEWLDPALHGSVLEEADARGLRRDGWFAGTGSPPPPAAVRRIGSAQGTPRSRARGRIRTSVAHVLDKATSVPESLTEQDVSLLFETDGREVALLYEVADEMRAAICGDDVTYVVNRNINYTNMCYFRCGFCAFSKGPKSLNLRGAPYLLSPEEVGERAREAWDAGATEVCMQGGIHGSFTGNDYVAYLQAVKSAVPAMHVHAFTALEVWQGAAALGEDVSAFLARLKSAGLATLPGTAAEILDDEIRAIICPDKIDTEQWCAVHRLAHAAGLRSNATIMFGTVESPRSWARHLLRVRRLHDEIRATGGGGLFEFVPLPFVHMGAPIYLRGAARRGPTFEEALKMHAVARIALRGAIDNIQVSWVKMGPEGAKLALQVGANDLGGTLMNESISRAAGAEHGQELPAQAMEELIRSIGRTPRRRSTLYDRVTA